MCLLVIAGFFGFITFKSDVASAAIIYVGIGLGNDSATINGGIALADPGDTVYVYNGIYYENVEVNKTINLIGEDWFRTIINGSGSGDVVNVTADFVNISGFTVTNGEIGISISSSNNTITGNNVTSNKWYGIFLSFSDYNTLADNIVSLYDKNAFYLFYSDNNIFTNNNIYNFVPIIYDSNGFALFYSTYNTITANNIYLNHEGIGLSSYSNWNNIIANTLFRNVVGIHLSTSCNWNNIIANNIMKNWWGLYIIISIENKITNNYISSNNEYGIYLATSSDNTIITDNIISSNNDDGILLSSSSNNNITANVISDNLEGINVSSLSDNNIIIGNNVSNNSYGIHIEDSLNNRIYHNNIINNTNQAYDDTNNGNQWDNGYPSGGNYWSDFDEPGEGAFDGYKGPDQNVFGSDDIVDLGPPIGGKNPYIIDGDSQDNYPLIKFVKYLFLYEGWNLISIPFIQPDTNLDIVLNSIKGSYDAVQWYNVSDTSDPWKHNSTKKPSYLNDLDDIHHMMGFWIHITQPGGVLFQYFGIPPTENQSITLHPGWNLVGYPSLISYNRTQGLNNISFGKDVDSIWAYDAATQKWEEIGEPDYFEIGRGYWIHSKVTKTWEIPL